MPELKYLRGVRVPEYDEDEWLQDGAADEHPLGGQVPRHRPPRRATTGRSREPQEIAESRGAEAAVGTSDPYELVESPALAAVPETTE